MREILSKILLNVDKSLHRIILGIFIVSFFIYYTLASFVRYDNFYTGKMDLGNMTQTVWNTSQGRFFQLTSNDGTENFSRLATHSDFILILFTPFYWIWDTPKVLLFFQALITALGAIYVYLLSGKIIKDENIALAFAFSYLLFPPLGWTTLFEFHAVSLATTFLLAATYYLTEKKYNLFLLFAILSGICKENIWLIVALYGPILFYYHKKRLLGTIVFFAGIIIFYLLLWKAIPWAAGTSGHFAMSYFNMDGSSPSDLIKDTIRNPINTLSIILQQERLDYLHQLVIPFGYLPLLFPFWLIFAGADLFINLLSKKGELHTIYFHYTATVTPYLFISAIYAVRFVKKLSNKILNDHIAFYIIFWAIIGAYNFGPLPFSRNPNDEMFTEPLAYRDEFDEILKKIPAEASVAAGNEIGSHLSHRENIYSLAIDVIDADYVVLFLRNPDPSELKDNNELKIQLSQNPEFEKWYEKNGLTIFKKKTIG